MRLTQGFLEGLAEIMEDLNRESELRYVSPRVAVFSALFMTFLAAFTCKPATMVIILSVSLAVVLLSRVKLKSWLKVVGINILWALVVVLPLLVSRYGAVRYQWTTLNAPLGCEGISGVFSFIARVGLSAAVFTAFIFALGWRRLVEGLSDLGLPKELVFELGLVIISLPPLLRELSKMISAREARIVGETKLTGFWRVLATVAGDLLVRGYERAWRVEKAVRARTFGRSAGKSGNGFKKGDAALILTNIAVFILSL